ncbi:MAG TPA: hypothetical protein VHS31_07425 [Tepidisphaeraceae bacterium]|jgi:hypothetical protein|nr:hypothetical protein [Tepidisphaeraceae bacterium]
MVSQNVNKLYQAVQALTDSERDELRRLLNARSTSMPASIGEGQLAQVLLARGVISQLRPKSTDADIARFDAWKPVPIQGKPISETIIEERR